MSENTNPTPTRKPQDHPGDGASSADVLRSMDEDSDRLAKEIDEAREAVQAAHRADSMTPPGEQEFASEVVDNAPVRGDAPAEPRPDDGEPDRS